MSWIALIMLICGLAALPKVLEIVITIIIETIWWVFDTWFSLVIMAIVVVWIVGTFVI